MSGEAERAAAIRAEWEAEEQNPLREHTAYMDEMGNPDECTEDCPGCHWEGNKGCEAITSGCDICDPDGTYAYAPENAEKLHQIRSIVNEYRNGEHWSSVGMERIAALLDGAR